MTRPTPAAARRAVRAKDNAALAALGGAGMAKEGSERPGIGPRTKTGRKQPRKAKSPTLSKLKKALWLEMSLFVRSWSPVCLACGSRPSQCAAHIVPSHEGAATRFFLPNLYPACRICNGLENWNRGSWVYKHKEMFGADFVDALYSMSDSAFQIKKHWVIEQTDRIRRLRTLAEERVRAALK